MSKKKKVTELRSNNFNKNQILNLEKALCYAISYFKLDDLLGPSTIYSKAFNYFELAYHESMNQLLNSLGYNELVEEYVCELYYDEKNSIVFIDIPDDYHLIQIKYVTCYHPHLENN